MKITDYPAQKYRWIFPGAICSHSQGLSHPGDLLLLNSEEVCFHQQAKDSVLCSGEKARQLYNPSHMSSKNLNCRVPLLHLRPSPPLLVQVAAAFITLPWRGNGVWGIGAQIFHKYSNQSASGPKTLCFL